MSIINVSDFRFFGPDTFATIATVAGLKEFKVSSLVGGFLSVDTLKTEGSSAWVLVGTEVVEIPADALLGDFSHVLEIVDRLYPTCKRDRATVALQTLHYGSTLQFQTYGTLDCTVSRRHLSGKGILVNKQKDGPGCVTVTVPGDDPNSTIKVESHLLQPFPEPKLAWLAIETSQFSFTAARSNVMEAYVNCTLAGYEMDSIGIRVPDFLVAESCQREWLAVVLIQKGERTSLVKIPGLGHTLEVENSSLRTSLAPKTQVLKLCSTCRHERNDSQVYPCNSCFRCTRSGPYNLDRWEAK